MAAVAVTSSLVLFGSIYGGKIYAESADRTIQDTFVSTLAQKLGVTEEKVETALTETREVIHEERETAREAAIATALENGDLTQKEVDILNAMHEIREEIRAKALEAGERPQRPGSLVDMVDELNEAGIKVTEEELDALHEKIQELDLGFGRRGGGRGMGMHMGM